MRKMGVMEGKGILLVDDEALALKYFIKAFGGRYPIHAAASAAEALEMLDQRGGNIGVVVTDQRMPESNGIDLLKVIRDRHPCTVRVLTTAYSEIDTLVEAINSGTVFSFVSKPWRLEELERTLRKALAKHGDQVAAEALNGERSRELKERLLEDHASQIGLIAARIGHYVRNALCPVTVLVDQLIRENRPQGSDEFLPDLRTHLNEVSSMLGDLERASRPLPPGDFAPLDIERTLAEALETSRALAARKRLCFRKTTTGELPPVHGVVSKVDRLFRFLIAEEVVSLPPGSTVLIRCASKSNAAGLPGVAVEFEDFEPLEGDVAPESLFHPFNLRGPNPRDFGVFLASAYFLAKHHGGSLDARIKQGSGLVYELFLPLNPPAAIRKFESGVAMTTGAHP